MSAASDRKRDAYNKPLDAKYLTQPIKSHVDRRTAFPLPSVGKPRPAVKR